MRGSQENWKQNIEGEGEDFVGFFDKLKNMKDEYDRKENARQQAMAEEHQRRQQAKAEQERALYEKLENSELISSVVSYLSTVPEFGESQGSQDSNRRQVIIGEKIILLNLFHLIHKKKRLL